MDSFRRGRLRDLAVVAHALGQAPQNVFRRPAEVHFDEIARRVVEDQHGRRGAAVDHGLCLERHVRQGARGEAPGSVESRARRA